MTAAAPKPRAACLIGWPAAHSRSPLIHHHWLRKLGIVPGTRWSVIGADPGWRFETAPDDATEVGASAQADVLLVFVRAAAELEPTLVEHEQRVFPAGALWIAWPRKAAGHVSDLGDGIVWRDARIGFGPGATIDTVLASILGAVAAPPVKAD